MASQPQPYHQFPPAVARQPGRRHRSLPPARAFTLIELLLVISIIAILAALLFPVLASGKTKGKSAACVNNLKQLELCCQMYSGDNSTKLVGNLPQSYNGAYESDTISWVIGNMRIPADSTNVNFLRQSKLFPYGNNVNIYRCPADPSLAFGLPRVRSYSMNSWVGSRYMEQNGQARGGFRTFITETEISAVGPSELWLIADEHEQTIDDGWFLVTMNDSQPFASHPATRHLNASGIGFADGHAELFKLRDPGSLTLAPNAVVSPKNLDWIRLKQMTTRE